MSTVPLSPKKPVVISKIAKSKAAVTDDPTTTDIATGFSTDLVLTPAQITMFEYLTEINGQDYYNATDAAMGKLDNRKFLTLPIGFTIPNVDIADIGTPDATNGVTVSEQAQIYAMNKGAFTAGNNAIHGAILRVYLVCAGWLENGSTYEIRYEAPLENALEIFSTDWPIIKEILPKAKKLAYLLPIVSENVFRTLGHHYLKAQATAFESKYARAFASCVESDLTDYLPPDELYHTAAHWVSLKRAMEVSQNIGQSIKLPNALVIRSRAAPAGTALITTSVAILNAIEGTGLKEAYLKAANIDEKILTVMTAKVVNNPGAYHTVPTAYGFRMLNAEEKAELDAAKKLASTMAPILQGFVDSLPKDCDLAMAKALGKHANLNPTLRKQSKAFFAMVSKQRPSNIMELVSATFRGIDNPNVSAKLEVEDED